MSIKLYWCRGKGDTYSDQQNFGDYLSPLIVESLANKKVVFSPARRADMIAIGTVLKRVFKARGWPLRHRIHIWGTGGGEEDVIYPDQHFYHAVRGPHTRAKINAEADTIALGDPGLLSETLLPSTPVNKQHDFGIVPHYLDKNTAGLTAIKTQLPSSTIIDVYAPVLEVLKTIRKCKFIFSSSLHGLIVADALGVPNQWVQFSKQLHESKYYDYFASQQITMEPLEVGGDYTVDASALEQAIESYQRPLQSSLQQQLLHAFPFK